MRLPSEFVLVTKQLLYFDRYASSSRPTSTSSAIRASSLA